MVVGSGKERAGRRMVFEKGRDNRNDTPNTSLCHDGILRRILRERRDTVAQHTQNSTQWRCQTLLDLKPHSIPPKPQTHPKTNPTSSTGKPILVPLTTSLYVPGTLADPDNVIVDVGTGFYVEKVRPFVRLNHPAQPLLYTERGLKIQTSTRN
jgi:hypothetical protein